MTPERTRLSLFDIESAWLDLIQAREEAEALEDLAEREAGLVAVDGAIAEYVAREVQKVDGIRGIVRRLRAEAVDAKAEKERQRAREHRAEELREKILHCVQTTMEMVDKKRIDGKTGYLLLKGNGGLQPLQVDGWDSEERCWTAPSTPLPVEYKLVTVRIPSSLMPRIGGLIGVEILASEPNNARIREALAAACETCGGRGYDVGKPETASCSTCGGTGKQVVPGARLLERGSHVEVKP